MAGERTSKRKDNGMEVFEFDCPECGAHIVGEVTRCPKCGVEFVFEEVEELTCPVCGAPVPAGSAVCPKCGAQLNMAKTVAPAPEQETPTGGSEPEMSEEAPSEADSMSEGFAMLVAEVKPLMALAREYDVDIAEGKRLIDKAVKVGKENDIQSAVNYVRECRSSIQDAIRNRVQEDIVQLGKLSEVASKMGDDSKSIEDAVSDARAHLDTDDYKAALSSAKEGRRRAEVLTGKYAEAMNLVDRLARMVENAERFFIDVQEVKVTLGEARRAEEDGDWSMMGILARKGREQMLASIPAEIQEELVKAKSTLLDAKAEGKEVSTLVKLLKEAGVALRRERYEESLEKLVEFKSEIRYL